MEPWMVVTMLGAVVLVFARLYGKGSQEGDDGRSADMLLKEMEGSLEAFALEVGQENKELLQHMHAMKEEQEKRFAALQARVERLEKDVLAGVHLKPVTTEPNRAAAPTRASGQVIQGRVDEERQAGMGLQPLADSSTTAGIGLHDRYQQIFEYDRQGKSIEWIARKTGVIKGEVQLILKLAQQEESGGV